MQTNYQNLLQMFLSSSILFTKQLSQKALPSIVEKVLSHTKIFIFVNRVLISNSVLTATADVMKEQTRKYFLNPNLLYVNMSMQHHKTFSPAK